MLGITRKNMKCEKLTCMKKKLHVRKNAIVRRLNSERYRIAEIIKPSIEDPKKHCPEFIFIVVFLYRGIFKEMSNQ